MILLRAEFAFHWGFWARPLILSARQPTMIVPPPTMFVGALARGLAELLRARGVWVPEYRREGGRYYVSLARWLGQCVERVYFRVLRGGVSAAIDKTRVFQGPYIRAKNIDKAEKCLPLRGSQRPLCFAVRDLGKVYSPGTIAEFAALLRDTCELRYNGTNIILSADDLRAITHAITRLGPAEGVVTVTKVEIMNWKDECKEIHSDDVWLNQPCPYFPWSDGELPPPWGITRFLDWRKERVWTDERVYVNENEYITYAVPESEWSKFMIEFPPCITLRAIKVKFVECKGCVYVEPKAIK
jgi:hypothetical protein